MEQDSCSDSVSFDLTDEGNIDASAGAVELLPHHIKIGPDGVVTFESAVAARLHRLAKAAEGSAEQTAPAPVGIRVDL